VANAVGYLASILLGALHQGHLEEGMERLEVTLGLRSSQTKMAPDVEPNTTKQN
jgi:hypothetical protein